MDELLVKKMGAHERGVEERPQLSRQHPLEKGRRVAGFLLAGGTENRAPGGLESAHGGHGLQMSKKLNHCVGCSRTVSSRIATQRRAASSAPPRATSRGSATLTR